MKALQVKMDDDYPAHPVDNRIEEQFEIMQKSLRELNLKGKDIWCTNCVDVFVTLKFYSLVYFILYFIVPQWRHLFLRSGESLI